MPTQANRALRKEGYRLYYTDTPREDIPQDIYTLIGYDTAARSLARHRKHQSKLNQETNDYYEGLKQLVDAYGYK